MSSTVSQGNVPDSSKPSESGGEYAPMDRRDDTFPPDALALEKHAVISTGIEVTDASEGMDGATDRVEVEKPAAHPARDTRVDTHLPLRSRKRSPRSRIIHMMLLAVLLLAILMPLVVTVSYALSAYGTYTALRSHAASGVHHLLAVKTLFTTSKAHPMSVFDSKTLAQAEQELIASRKDFQQVKSLISTPVVQMIGAYLPQYRPQVTTARAASQIGIDVTDIGQVLITAMQKLAPKFQGSLLSDTSTRLVTAPDLAMARTTLNAVLPLIDDIQQQTHQLSLDALPAGLISVQQREQVQELIRLLPQVETALVQGRDLLDSFGWLLGVDQPRTFLVQTLDRAELRATGGFTGQYGELHIENGRMAPFSLRDISLIEYADRSPTSDQLAPGAYRSWWPFANWGLRDSNLSADFPTSAQIATHQYQQEVNRKVDGVVVFTPFFIEHILQILGPITIPSYNETITAQNLEQRLHYYQLDNAGIAKQLHMQGKDSSTSDRKQFTALVAHTVMDRIRHASPEELMALVREIPHSLRTRDLQIYFTNPQLEDLLMQYDIAGQLDRSTAQDGLYVVQANVSASKASQYVRTSISDTVSLDAAGGATHVMHLSLAYTEIGQIYGLDTYRDYVRVYVPPSAKLLWGDGFDTGKPLCDGPFGPCPADSVYPHDELVCPTGQYQVGFAAPMLNDPYAGEWHPLDTIGPPTNLVSDEPGRAMFGGYVVVPKNCTMTVTLSWYVPPVGHSSYELFVQRQAGTFPELDLTILPTPVDCAQLATSGVHFAGVLTEDTLFPLKSLYSSLGGSKASCYPQPGV
jgi:hypothetical protein